MSRPPESEHPESQDFSGTSHDVASPSGHGRDAATGSGRSLRRSKEDRVIAGVCGGIARYVDIEPVFLRIAFILMLVPGGLGLLIYVIAWIAMPEFSSVEDERQAARTNPPNPRLAGSLVGGALILLGAFILLREFIDWLDFRFVGGIFLIVIGALVVIRGIRRE